MSAVASKETAEPIQCAVCKKVAYATRIVVMAAGIGDGKGDFVWTWTKLPRGWWRLEESTKLSLHCRCPGCLKTDRKKRA